MNANAAQTADIIAETAALAAAPVSFPIFGSVDCLLDSVNAITSPEEAQTFRNVYIDAEVAQWSGVLRTPDEVVEYYGEFSVSSEAFGLRRNGEMVSESEYYENFSTYRRINNLLTRRVHAAHRRLLATRSEALDILTEAHDAERNLVIHLLYSRGFIV